MTNVCKQTLLPGHTDSQLFLVCSYKGGGPATRWVSTCNSRCLARLRAQDAAQARRADSCCQHARHSQTRAEVRKARQHLLITRFWGPRGGVGIFETAYQRISADFTHTQWDQKAICIGRSLPTNQSMHSNAEAAKVLRPEKLIRQEDRAASARPPSTYHTAPHEAL